MTITSNILHTLNSKHSPDADRYARIVLSVAAEPGDTTLGRLIAVHGAPGALRLLADDTTTATGVNTEELNQLRRRTPVTLTSTMVAGVLRTLENLNINVLTPSDAEWPHGLADLGARAPFVLFTRGNQKLLASPSVVAIIGARAATTYGTHVAAELTADLVKDGQVILASGSYGIDAEAHRAALAAGGATIAFLAGGLDRPYPVGHAGLFDRIIQHNGVILTETPPTLPPTRWQFLRRTHLIAALADLIVIVEAGARSGSLHVAAHATALRRPVGAVPGPITSAASTGCHELLRSGRAVPVTNAHDVHALQPARALSSPGSGDFPSLDSVDVLIADWDDDPALTAEHLGILRELPEREVQDILTGNARSVEREFLALLDGVRAATTRQLLYRHGIDLDA